MTYAEKLKDPRWQKKRLEIFNRDNWKCTKCGNDKITLAVHHESYSGNPWEVSNDKLTTICEPCHTKEHNIITIEPSNDEIPNDAFWSKKPEIRKLQQERHELIESLTDTEEFEYQIPTLEKIRDLNIEIKKGYKNG